MVFLVKECVRSIGLLSFPWVPCLLLLGIEGFSFGKIFSPGHNLIECEVKVLQLDSLDTYCGIMFSWLAPL